MSQQDVITFPAPTQEQADDLILQSVFERQIELTRLYAAIAEMVYIARAKWIGGMCLPWDLLTAGQRQTYINEVRELVKGDAGER